VDAYYAEDVARLRAALRQRDVEATEEQVFKAYVAWSEDNYCAYWMVLDDDRVQRFVAEYGDS
jgi:hypothetical protein